MASVEVEVAPAIEAISSTPVTLEAPPLSEAPAVDEPSTTINETPEDNESTKVSSEEVGAVEEKQDEKSVAVTGEVVAEGELASVETEVKEKTGEDSKESPPEEVAAEDVKPAELEGGEKESAEVGLEAPLPREKAEEEKDDVAE